MDSIDNNQFEVRLNTKSKRKIATPCPNAYLNPALDLLANDDPMCNTALEIVPNKKRKRTRSCDTVAFENTALDLGVSKAAVSEFLARELENVRKNVRNYETPIKINTTSNSEANDITEPVYANIEEVNENIDITEETNATNPFSAQNSMQVSAIQADDVNDVEMDSGISVLEQKSMNTINSDFNASPIINNSTNIQANVTNQIFVNNASNLSLSFIDRLALDSPNLSNHSLYLDDDLNESNIMEIKTITIITKKKRIPDNKKNTNPFLNSNLDMKALPGLNPFLNDTAKPELEYHDEVMNRPVENNIPQGNLLMPRRLFHGDTNSTISTVNESVNDQPEYENIDGYRSDSPIYENINDVETNENFNKQSKILGHDVSQFSASDIINLNRFCSQANSSNESNDSKRDFKHHLLKASNKLSKKVFKTLKRTFKSEKTDNNITLNPYEVPRKPQKQKAAQKDTGIENPALNLDNSDEIEIEEIDDDEHQYETIKTMRNTQLNMNVTPLRERSNDRDLSNSKNNTPGKKVRFDSTLNQEKIITGDSFDYDIQSPGFDVKIDKYHDELENCINERKFLQQNM